MKINPEAKKYDGRWKVVSLEPGTCTDIASKHFSDNFFKESPEIIYTKSFKEGQTLIIENQDHVMLIPDIHWMSYILRNSSGYQSQRLFELDNPSIYLATNPNSKRDDMSLVTLKTLEFLVSEFEITEKTGNIVTDFTTKSIYDLFYTNNTQDAARLAAEDKARFCITNQAGLDRYSLNPIKKFDYSVIWYGINFDPNQVSHSEDLDTGFCDFLARARSALEKYRELR